VAAEPDLTCGSNICIRYQVGSLHNADSTAFTPIEEATSILQIPISWVKTILSNEELAQLATMPLRIIQATIEGLYRSDYVAAPDGPVSSIRKLNTGMQQVPVPKWLKKSAKA
jgi:putative DNA primase/helicase